MSIWEAPPKRAWLQVMGRLVWLGQSKSERRPETAWDPEPREAVSL
jgi:hypothetical protein